MIKVENLSKYYGQHLALRNLNFSVEENEILGFLGPNGAGKTTTMNIMTGYLSSSSGSVTVDGLEILEEPEKVKAKIGYLPETPPLYLDMKVWEYLDFVFDLKKLRSNFDKQEHIDEIASLVKIDDVMGRLIKNLSKGYKQRVGIAQALLGYPQILILDEPTVGLDPQQIIEIRDLIKNLGETHTIILSSHILSEVQAVCDRIIVINNGEIVADGKSNEIANNMNKKQHFAVSVEGDEKEVYSVLRNIEGVTDVKFDESLADDNSCRYDVEAESDIRREISKHLSEAGFVLLELKISDLSLEELFCKLVETDDTGSDDLDNDENVYTEENNENDEKLNEDKEENKNNDNNESEEEV